MALRNSSAETPMKTLRDKVEAELLRNILPFWVEHAIDEEHGGFHGRIANDLTIDPHADKGLILNARILWTFAKAYSVYRDGVYLKTAQRAYNYILRHFWDAEFGGVFWMVDFEGRPADTLKRIFGQAFTVYALAEYAGATGDVEAVAKAMQLVHMIDSAAHDADNGGYFETYKRDWTLAAGQRLSEVDMDEKKSMNTHLHLLVAYAALLRVHEDAPLRQRIRELIEIFLNHIFSSRTHHLILFFDEQWHPRSEKISFGHDVEASWLLVEAAEALGDEKLLERARIAAVNMAQAVLDEGLDSDGSLFYEADPAGIIDSDKHWWPQAEAVVGFLNAYQISGRQDFYDAAERAWAFIERCIIDRKHGEWFSLVSKAGVPDPRREKAGPWKCPYHNSRTCLEVMERIGAGMPALADLAFHGRRALDPKMNLGHCPETARNPSSWAVHAKFE